MILVVCPEGLRFREEAILEVTNQEFCADSQMHWLIVFQKNFGGKVDLGFLGFARKNEIPTSLYQ